MMACRGAVHCSFKCQTSSYRFRSSSVVSNPPLFEFVAMFMAKTLVASLNLGVLNQICSVIKIRAVNWLSDHRVEYQWLFNEIVYISKDVPRTRLEEMVARCVRLGLVHEGVSHGMK